jgi:hypothetical protein
MLIRYKVVVVLVSCLGLEQDWDDTEALNYYFGCINSQQPRPSHRPLVSIISLIIISRGLLSSSHVMHRNKSCVEQDKHA